MCDPSCGVVVGLEPEAKNDNGVVVPPLLVTITEFQQVGIVVELKPCDCGIAGAGKHDWPCTSKVDDSNKSTAAKILVALLEAFFTFLKKE
jgi:hypothetical protein